MRPINFRRLAASLTALALISGCASCGSKGTELVEDTPSEVNMAEEELPYGATLIELTPEYDEKARIMTDFDRRFFTQEEDGSFPEIYKIIDYFYALQSADGDVMAQVIYPPYMDYICQNSGYADAQECVDYLNSSYTELFGGDFTFSVLCINNCKDETDSDAKEAFAEADANLEKISAGLSEKVEQRSLISIGDIEDIYYYTMYSCNGNSSNILTQALGRGMQLCVYKIDGEYWIL